MNWYKRHIKIAMPKAIGWSNDDFNKIKKLLEEGKPFNYVAKLFNTSGQNISNLNNKYKWVESKQRGRQKGDGGSIAKTKEQIEKQKKDDQIIANLYLLPEDGGKGLSPSKIQQEYGFNAYYIKLALNRLGLSEHIRGRSDAQKQKWQDPEHRKKQEELWKNPEFIEKQREGTKKRWQDPEQASIMLDHLNKNRNTNTEQMNLLWQDPEFKKRRQQEQREIKKEWWSDPENKQNASRRMVEYWENYPGGFDAWVSDFPPEKQRQIMTAINAKGSLPV